MTAPLLRQELISLIEMTSSSQTSNRELSFSSFQELVNSLSFLLDSSQRYNDRWSSRRNLSTLRHSTF